MIPLTNDQNFQQVLTEIHNDLQSITKKVLKLEKSDYSELIIDSQTFRYSLSDKDNSLKNDLILPNGKWNEFNEFEIEYSLDSESIASILVKVVEIDSELEVSFDIVFIDEIPDDFSFKESMFYRLLA